jgi:hypothetical protein
MKVEFELSEQTVRAIKAIVADAVKEALTDSGQTVDLSTSPVTIPVAEGKQAPATVDSMSPGDIRELAKEFAKQRGSRGREALLSVLKKFNAKSISAVKTEDIPELAKTLAAGIK